MKTLRALSRLCLALIHVVRAWLIITFTFGKLSPQAQGVRVEQWAREMLRILGVDLCVRGPVPKSGPVLLVANHISWLDIVVIHAACHCRFVSKAEVRHWPVLGRLASGAGTLFIERESRRDAMRVVHRMTERLLEGDILAVFPEGTTGDGKTLLPFHSNLIQAAISADRPVQALALRFVDTVTGGVSFAPSYVGSDTLLSSFWRILTAPAITAVMAFGQPDPARGRQRREWAQALYAEVDTLRHRESTRTCSQAED